MLSLGICPLTAYHADLCVTGIGGLEEKLSTFASSNEEKAGQLVMFLARSPWLAVQTVLARFLQQQHENVTTKLHI